MFKLLFLSLLVATTNGSGIIDFEGFNEGDIVTDLGSGVTVAAQRNTQNSGILPGDAQIFNSAAPTGGDTDLGTPNGSFGGPGVGAGGEAGSLFANDQAHGLVLIISEGSAVPDDNQYGGILTFTLDPPRDVDSIGLLDNEGTTVFKVFTSDGGKTVIKNQNGGDNSYELVAISKPSVKKIVVKLPGSGAITHINFSPADPKCTTSATIDFERFSEGQSIRSAGQGLGVNFRAQKRLVAGGPLVDAQAMIFDSSDPTGGDTDLGTPHSTFGGPGIGSAGRMDELFENKYAQGHVLIISEDDDASDPDDNANGGKLRIGFREPTAVNTIGLLDNDEVTTFIIHTEDGGKTTIINRNGGDNSFENIQIWKPAVTKIFVIFKGSGAITHVDLALCD